jgi:hypothetical protein
MPAYVSIRQHTPAYVSIRSRPAAQASAPAAARVMYASSWRRTRES